MEITQPVRALDQLTAEALALPPAERELLAERLFDSLHDEDAPLSPEWEAEIARRIQEIDDGIETYDFDEVIAEMLQKYQ